MSSDDGGSARHRVAIKTAITAIAIDNKPISIQTKQICVIRPTTRTTLQPEETTNAQLSDKEIEKNFINNNNNNSNSNNNANNTNNINGEKRISGLWDKKRWDNHENSVVFNFVNRKGVPNYIDSEGPLQRRDNSYVIIYYFYLLTYFIIDFRFVLFYIILGDQGWLYRFGCTL